MVFYQEEAVVLKNFPLNPSHSQLVLSAPQLSQEAKPGQFIQVRCSDNLLPLLRRPFGLAGINPKKKELEVIYRVVGPGTGWLKARVAGQKLSLLGPLGKGFNPPLPAEETTRVMVVTGGTGLAPVLPLLKQLYLRDTEIYSFVGFRNKNESFRLAEVLAWSGHVWLATDDGSRPALPGGRTAVKVRRLKSLIGDVFQDNLKSLLKSIQTTGRRKIKVYSCGPWAMIKKVAQLCQHYNLAGEMSLETIMGCGFGVCLGCVWPTKSGYMKVCTDGPVFPVEQLLV